MNADDKKEETCLHSSVITMFLSLLVVLTVSWIQESAATDKILWIDREGIVRLGENIQLPAWSNFWPYLLNRMFSNVIHKQKEREVTLPCSYWSTSFSMFCSQQYIVLPPQLQYHIPLQKRVAIIINIL